VPKTSLTAQRIRLHKCPPERAQAFLWDASTPGLGVRVTPKGEPTFVYQGNFGGKSIRLKIGSPKSWSIAEAQARSRELRRLIDQGIDPRQHVKKLRNANQNERWREHVSARGAWQEYLASRKPFWGARHYADHEALSRNLVHKNKRYQDGILTPILSMPIASIDRKVLEAWAKTNSKNRPTVTRLAWRCLKAFLNWSMQQEAYAKVFDGVNPANNQSLKEILGHPNAKQDAIQLQQLPSWFAAVKKLQNPVARAYLQTLLLTGGRPSEILNIRWVDVDFKWRQMTIGDKYEGRRTIPLTQYVASLMSDLPKTSEWVFTGRKNRPYTGTIAAINQISNSTQIPGLTRNGVRRSFRTLSEWIESPVGVVAQIMGHKPSAIAEKHYTVRPIDLLRHHHQKIEDWILRASDGHL
jgi:integrase